MGYRSIIDSHKKLLISDRLCDTINSLINKNLTEIQYEAEEHSDCG